MARVPKAVVSNEKRGRGRPTKTKGRYANATHQRLSETVTRLEAENVALKEEVTTLKKGNPQPARPHPLTVAMLKNVPPQHRANFIKLPPAQARVVLMRIHQQRQRAFRQSGLAGMQQQRQHAERVLQQGRQGEGVVQQGNQPAGEMDDEDTIRVTPKRALRSGKARS